MKKRSLFAVFILPFVTFGIYGIVWAVKTKGEMNRLGAKIPTAWLLIVPFANFYWYYKYSEGVEQVTYHKMSTVVVFLLELFLGVIGNTILQSEFNKLADTTQAIAANNVTPDASSVNNTNLNVDMVSENANVVPATTVASSQPTNTMPAAPVEPVISSMPADQYRVNTPTPEPTANPQPISPIAPEDNNQTPPTPNQF